MVEASSSASRQSPESKSKQRSLRLVGQLPYKLHIMFLCCLPNDWKIFLQPLNRLKRRRNRTKRNILFCSFELSRFSWDNFCIVHIVHRQICNSFDPSCLLLSIYLIIFININKYGTYKISIVKEMILMKMSATWDILVHVITIIFLKMYLLSPHRCKINVSPKHTLGQ